MNSSDNQLLLDPLTDRELDVLRLMTAGRTTNQIAAELVVTMDTVRWYAKQIYSKLGVHSRTQAVLRAVDLGLFDAHGTETGPPGSPPPQHNLPAYATTFYGREKELNDLTALLADPQVRLVTLAGPGGMGKTRLCVEAARYLLDHFADGVFFIPLAPLNAADEIVPAIAREIQLRLKTDADPEEQLLRYLQARQTLLVLDNFEHLLEGVRLVVRLLQATAGVKILTTSQTSLDLQQEWVRYLDGMSIPSAEEAEDVAAFGALELFVDRARHVRRDFSLADHRDCAVEVCRLVRGVPLAIELAAAWLKTLSCADVVAEIRRTIDFLATRQHDVDARHQSLRAVFDHSWRLLAADERRVLMRLSVFRGGFGRTAAEQVAAASLQTLSRLTEKSFLTRDAAGRYEIHDLLRQYAAQQLEKVSTDALSVRSKMLLTWSSLVKGDFEKARELAEGILNRPQTGIEPAVEAFGLALMGVLAGMDEDYDGCLQMCAASLSLGEKLPGPQDPITALFTHLGLAVGTVGLGDYYCTRYYLRSALKQATILRSPAFITLCLPVVAIILAHQVETERAVELLGLAFTHRASAPSWMQEWRPVAGLLVDLEAELGAAAHAAAWARGKRLDLEAVAAELLKDFQIDPLEM